MKWLTLRTREVLEPRPGEERQVVEVLDGETVVGQLPVTRAEYEMLPQNLGKLKVELIVGRAEVRGHSV